MRRQYNFTAKDAFNSLSGVSMQNHVDEVITVVGAAIEERADENGEIREVGLLVDETGTVYTGISGTAIRAIDKLIDMFEADENMTSVNIKLEMRTAKSGRNFITIVLI